MHHEDAASAHGFETPDRDSNIPMLLSESHLVMEESRSGYNCISPTSVEEFENFHATNPACARVQHRQMEAIYPYSKVASPMAHRGVPQARYEGEKDDCAPIYESDINGNYPKPQNLRDNPERQAKIKTELCQFWIEGRECPWGVSCNFAHGEHELKFRYSTLLLMEGSGQIANAYTFLCRPCLTFVSTGAW